MANRFTAVFASDADWLALQTRSGIPRQRSQEGLRLVSSR